MTTSLPTALDISEREPFNKKVLDAAFTYIINRFLPLESYAPSWQAAVDQLNAIGLERLNAAIQPIYDRLVAISQIGSIFTTTSTSAVALQAGTATFAIKTVDQAAFAAAAYLGFQKVGDPSTYMSGRLASYDRTTGTLTVTIDSVEGTGTCSNWIISAAVAPAFENDLFNGLASQIAFAIAPLATSNSPSLTGVPVTQDPPSGDNSQQIPSTKWVQSTLSALKTALFGSTSPAMDGSASAGSSTIAARADHIHPTDTSRASLAFASAAFASNRIINGAMDVQQRGAGNFAIPANSFAMTADRWAAGVNGVAGVGYITSNAPAGFRSALAINGASGVTAAVMYTRLRSADVYDLSSKTITVSAWVYASVGIPANGLVLYLQAPSATDNFGSTSILQSLPFAQAIPAATWTQVSVTVSNPGDTSKGLQVYFNFGAIGNSYVYMTGVDLYVGSTVRSFVRRTFATEFALCQQFLEMSYPYGQLPGSAPYPGADWYFYTYQTAYQTTVGRQVNFRVEKAFTPQIFLYSPGAGQSGKARDVNSSNDVAANIGYPGLTGFNWYAQIANAQTGVQMFVHWVANCEL